MTKNDSTLPNKLPEEILRLYQNENMNIFKIYHLDHLNLDGFIKTSSFSDYHSISKYLKDIFQLKEPDHQHLLLTLLYNRVIYSDFLPLSKYLNDIP